MHPPSRTVRRPWLQGLSSILSVALLLQPGVALSQAAAAATPAADAKTEAPTLTESAPAPSKPAPSEPVPAKSETVPATLAEATPGEATPSESATADSAEVAGMATVTIAVKGAKGKPLELKIDGRLLPGSEAGHARPIASGEHEFSATAPGMTVATARVTLAPGATEVVLLTLEESPDAPAQKENPQTTEFDLDDASAVPAAAYFAIGGGILVLGGAVFYGFLGESKRADADDICGETSDINGRVPDPGRCWESKKFEIAALDDEADAAFNASTGLAAAGATALAVGVTIILVQTSKQSREKRQQTEAGVHPWVGLGSAGLYGRF